MRTVSAWRLEAGDPSLGRWVDEVAARMRLTLAEVLGVERGEAMYSMDWLRKRVMWHLDSQACDGAVFLAHLSDAVGASSVGHTIVRVEHDVAGRPYGLFSTTYVHPDCRGRGVAQVLLSTGEAWLADRGATRFATDTAETNTPLLRLFEGRGYRVVKRVPGAQMVRLARGVDAGAPF